MSIRWIDRSQLEVLTFKVFVEPPKRGAYYIVRVYRSNWKMNKALRHDFGFKNKCIARCVSYTNERDGRLTNEVGTIYFSIENIGVGVISHECLHALFYWAGQHETIASISFGSLPKDIDERLCYAHGEMVRTICNRFIKEKLYTL